MYGEVLMHFHDFPLGALTAGTFAQQAAAYLFLSR